MPDVTQSENPMSTVVFAHADLTEAVLRDGSVIGIRRATLEDEPAIRAFLGALNPESRHFRFGTAAPDLDAAARSWARAQGDDRRGDEDILEARVGEDLGLADGRDGQPDRAGPDLAPRELDALVGLDVRAKRDAALAHDRCHPGDPRVRPVEVDDDRRRLEVCGDLIVEQPVDHRSSLRRVGPRVSAAVPFVGRYRSARRRRSDVPRGGRKESVP